MNNNPIGIFDSGLGGMTVLKKLIKIMPNESFIFFGDTAHVPYGNKSIESIQKFSIEIVEFLQTHSVKLIVVACNTASAVAIEAMQQKVSVPIIGVITPIAQYLNSNSEYMKVGIIGTQNTINSNAYNKVIANFNSEIEITSQACPLFVPIIEEGLENHKIATMIVKEYLSIFIKDKIDLLILGCTHYPIIQPIIQTFLPHTIQITDSASIVSEEVLKYLKDNHLLNSDNHGEVKVFVSDEPQQFAKHASKYLGKPISDIKKIIL